MPLAVLSFLKARGEIPAGAAAALLAASRSSDLSICINARLLYYCIPKLWNYYL
jgi:hypothetical protein